MGWGGVGGGSGSPGTFGWGWVGWFFTCCIENQLFLVGLVDKLFQPTRNLVELVENDGIDRYNDRGLLPLRHVNKCQVQHGWRLVPYPQEYGQFFQPETVEMHSIGALV